MRVKPDANRKRRMESARSVQFTALQSRAGVPPNVTRIWRHIFGVSDGLEHGFQLTVRRVNANGAGRAVHLDAICGGPEAGSGPCSGAFWPTGPRLGVGCG